MNDAPFDLQRVDKPRLVCETLYPVIEERPLRIVYLPDEQALLGGDARALDRLCCNVECKLFFALQFKNAAPTEDGSNEQAEDPLQQSIA